MADSEKRIIRYWLHDPVGNNEEMLTNFDTDMLKQAEESGFVFISEDSEGVRSIVKAKDIVEPTQLADADGVVFVMPKYVDDRVKATVACFDAVAKILDPVAVSTNSADDADSGSGNSSDPVAALLEAIERLRALEEDGR